MFSWRTSIDRVGDEWLVSVFVDCAPSEWQDRRSTPFYSWYDPEDRMWCSLDTWSGLNMIGSNQLSIAVCGRYGDCNPHRYLTQRSARRLQLRLERVLTRLSQNQSFISRYPSVTESNKALEFWE